MNWDNNLTIEIKDSGPAELLITGELSGEAFATFRSTALKKLGETATIAGFRPGHVPESILVDKLGEEKILLEMAEAAFRELYPVVLKKHEVDAIGRPEIVITKLVKDNPLGFQIKTAVYPKIELAGYREVVKKITNEPEEKSEVTEKEIEDVITALKQNPEFKEPPDLPAKVRENLTHEKSERAKDKRRLKIMDQLIENYPIVVPPVMLESEKDKMLAEMKVEIERMGLKFADYLTHLKKTEADLKQGWQADSEKRVKTGLLLEHLATLEKIVAPADEVEKEFQHLREHYPRAPEEGLRQYLTNLLRHEAVWRFLESQK